MVFISYLPTRCEDRPDTHLKHFAVRLGGGVNIITTSKAVLALFSLHRYFSQVSEDSFIAILHLAPGIADPLLAELQDGADVVLVKFPIGIHLFRIFSLRHCGILAG
jgi:hypothetical protein